MKKRTLVCLAAVAPIIVACGSDTTTVVHDRPVIVQPRVSGTTPSDIEAHCEHGYDNASHSCY